MAAASINVSQAQAAEVAAQLVALGVSFSYARHGELASAIGHQITVAYSRAELLAHCLQIAKERLARQGK